MLLGRSGSIMDGKQRMIRKEGGRNADFQQVYNSDPYACLYGGV